MLVLSRKAGEVIRVGNDIVITITRIQKHAVRVGVDAPDGTPIMRDELVDGHLGAQILKQQRHDAEPATGTDGVG